MREFLVSGVDGSFGLLPSRRKKASKLKSKMCNQILQCCAGSTKPQLFVGSLLTFLVALAFGWLGHSSQALYQDTDPSLAQDRLLAYYLHWAALFWLLAVVVLATLAAHHDQKHAIRAVSFHRERVPM